MDDFRIRSLDFADSQSGQQKDGSKKHPRQEHGEPHEDPTDQVALSSPSDIEDQPLGYLPPLSGEEPK